MIPAPFGTEIVLLVTPLLSSPVGSARLVVSGVVSIVVAVGATGLFAVTLEVAIGGAVFVLNGASSPRDDPAAWLVAASAVAAAAALPCPVGALAWPVAVLG